MLVAKFSSLIKKIALVFIVGTFVVLSLSLPAQATPSSLTKGEANLNDIQAKTDHLAKEDPLNLKDIQKRTAGGLNEVQGTADKDKMISPKDAQGQTTIEDQIKKILD